MDNKEKPRKNMAINNLDNAMIFIKSFIENITYGEMKDISKDKRKLNIIEELYNEFSRVLNDIDYLSKEKEVRNSSQA